MSSEKDNWFIEHFDSAGTAFGLRLKRKLESVKTDYQHIEMWDTDTFGYLMTIDGATMLTTRDNFLYHEMMAHPALFSHAAPRNVLIIGGGGMLGPVYFGPWLLAACIIALLLAFIGPALARRRETEIEGETLRVIPFCPALLASWALTWALARSGQLAFLAG